MTEALRPVAVYARISEDPSGEAQGVARQIEMAQEHADRRGLQIVATFSDNNISASANAHRPGYAALLDEMERGTFSAVLVFHTSRLWRNREQRAKGIRKFSEHGVSVLAVKGPELDLSTAYGRGMAGLLGEFDTMESEVKSERVRAAAAQRAREGRPSGPRMFGWDRIPDPKNPNRKIDVIDETAANLIREIVRRLLAGESLGSVTRWVESTGILPPKAYSRQAQGIEPMPGGTAKDTDKWRSKTVRILATRPANVALRLHHRGRPDEQLFPAAWPAILTMDEWEAVCALFKPGARQGLRSDRRHLLTGGVGYCGVCGAVLRVITRRKGNWEGHLYTCDTAKGCVGRNVAKLDAHVRAVVVERMRRDDAVALLAPPSQSAVDPVAEDERRLRVMLDETTESYLAGRITIGQMEAISARVTADLETLETRREHSSGLPNGMIGEVGTAVQEDNMGELWDSWDVHRRRALLQALGLRVDVLPARGGPKYKPEAVKFSWEAAQ